MSSSKKWTDYSDLGAQKWSGYTDLEDKKWSRYTFLVDKSWTEYMDLGDNYYDKFSVSPIFSPFTFPKTILTIVLVMLRYNLQHINFQFDMAESL